MAFDVPRDAVMRFDRVDLRQEPGTHPFERANAEAIEANWQAEFAANPALYDGRMMLMASLKLEHGVLTGICHETRYASLLHWRKNRETALAEHAFGDAALVSRDGALIAIRMAAHTAGPGRVYFAAGSLDAEDFTDGVGDIDANMRREVIEETGIDLAAVRPDAGYQMISIDRATMVLRVYRLADDAETIAGAIRAFVARQAISEIEAPEIIRAGAPLPHGVIDHMSKYCPWFFAQQR